MKKKKKSEVYHHGWEYFYKHSGKEFSVEGDRNSARTACVQYFKRKKIAVEVHSRYIDGVAHLMVKRLDKNK